MFLLIPEGKLLTWWRLWANTKEIGSVAKLDPHNTVTNAWSKFLLKFKQKVLLSVSILTILTEDPGPQQIIVVIYHILLFIAKHAEFLIYMYKNKSGGAIMRIVII